MITVIYIISAILAMILLVTVVEVLIMILEKPAKELPDAKDYSYYHMIPVKKDFGDLYLFLTGEQTEPSFSENEIYDMLKMQSEYMGNRFDCADFRAQMLFKIYKDCYDVLDEKCKELIKNTFLDFKYFMDEPGDDSMCFWSENHQIMFAVSEYLAGQEWPDEVFRNNGMTGREHMEKAKIRIDA